MHVATDSAFNADDTLVLLDGPVRRWVVRASSVLALTVYAAYLVYRALYTINPDAPVFSLLVYFAEAHGFLSLFFFFHSVWAIRGRQVVEPADGLKVDVFITTYNEDVDLLRQTVRAAAAMRYPHRTCVLDDGRRGEVRRMAEELDCVYLLGTDNRGDIYHHPSLHFAFEVSPRVRLGVDFNAIRSPQYRETSLAGEVSVGGGVAR